MVDETYQPKVYRKGGGDELVVASGGAITVESGGALTVAGVTVDENTLAMNGLTASAAELNILDGVGATAAEINRAADVSSYVLELTASGAIPVTARSIELNHASVVIAATIANAALMPGLVVFKDTSATGTAAHTVTLTAGTFNGTNNVATFDARDEFLAVYFDSTGRGQVVANVGSVALS